MISNFSTPQRVNPVAIGHDNSDNIGVVALHDKLSATPSKRTPLADLSSNKLQQSNHGILSGAVRVPVKDPLKDKSNTPKSAIKQNATISNSATTTINNFMRHTEASIKNIQNSVIATPSRPTLASSPVVNIKASTPTPSKSRSSSSASKTLATTNSITPRTPTRPMSASKQRPNTPTTPNQITTTVSANNIPNSPLSMNHMRNQSAATGASSHSILFSPERIINHSTTHVTTENIEKENSAITNSNRITSDEKNMVMSKKPLVRSLSAPKGGMGRSPQSTPTGIYIPSPNSLVFPDTSHIKKDGWDSNTIVSNTTKSVVAPSNSDNSNLNTKQTPSKQSSHTNIRSNGTIKSSITTADILSANKAAKNAAMASYKKPNYSQPVSILSNKSANTKTINHNITDVTRAEKDNKDNTHLVTTPIKKSDTTKTLSVTFSSSTKKAEKVSKDSIVSKPSINLKSPMKKMDQTNRKVIKKVKKSALSIFKNNNEKETEEDYIHKYLTNSFDADAILNALESSPHRHCNAPEPPSLQYLGSRRNEFELRRSFGSEISSVQGYTLEELSLTDTFDLSTNNTFILESNTQSNSFTLDTFNLNTSVASNGPKSSNAALFSQQLSQLLKDENLDLSNVEEDSSESFSPSKLSMASFWTLVSPKAKTTIQQQNLQQSENLETIDDNDNNYKLRVENSKSPLLINSNSVSCSASYSSFSPTSCLYPQSLLSVESDCNGSLKQSNDSLRINESNSSILNRGMLLDSTAGSSLEMSKILNRGMIMNTSDATINTQTSLYSPVELHESSSIKNGTNSIISNQIFDNSDIQDQSIYSIRHTQSISSLYSVELFDNSEINGELSCTDNLNPSEHDIGTKNSVFSLSFGNDENNTQNQSFGPNFGESSISETNNVSSESRLSPPTALSQSIDYQPRSLSSLPAPVIHTAPHVTSYLDYEDCSENSVDKAVIHDSFHLSDFDSAKNSRSFLSSIEFRSISSVPRYETNSFSIENSVTEVSPPLKNTRNDNNEKPDNSMSSFVSGNMNNTSISSYTSSVEELQQHNPKFKNEQWTSINYPNTNQQLFLSQKNSSLSIPIKSNNNNNNTSGVAISPSSSFILREDNDISNSCPDPIASQLLIFGDNNTRKNTTPIKSHFIPVHQDKN